MATTATHSDEAPQWEIRITEPSGEHHVLKFAADAHDTTTDKGRDHLAGETIKMLKKLLRARD